jgi:hypothetical protein
MSDTVTIRPRVVRQVSLDSGLPHDGFRAAYEQRSRRSTGWKRWGW